MSGILDLVSQLGKTLVNNAIDEFVESLNTAASNKPIRKKSPLDLFSNLSELDSAGFWDDLETRPTPKPSNKKKAIRPTLKKKQTKQNVAPESEPEPIVMSDAEVNEELRMIKEMLKKKSA